MNNDKLKAEIGEIRTELDRCRVIADRLEKECESDLKSVEAFGSKARALKRDCESSRVMLERIKVDFQSILDAMPPKEQK